MRKPRTNDQTFILPKPMVRTDDITIALTSCGRFELLEQTIASIEQTIDLTPYRRILTEDSKNPEHIARMKDAQKNGFLQGREILFTGGSGQTDLYKCHFYALKTLYEQIDTKYVFHCEDDLVFRKTDFDYFKLSYDLLEHDETVALTLLRDVWKDFGLKPTGMMKDRYYHILTDEEIEYQGYEWQILNPISSFSLQPGLRRTDVMKSVMFGYEDHVDESLVADRLSSTGLISATLKTGHGVYNHSNPIFNTTKNIQNLGFWNYIYTTLSGTIRYRGGLVIKWCRYIRSDHIRPTLLWCHSWLAIPLFQPLWKAVYMLGLAGMGYGYGVNQLGHAKQIVYRKYRYDQRQKDFILFDVGANVGQTVAEVLEYQRPHYQIYSFEPQASAFRKLNKRFGQTKNVNLLQQGLGAKPVKATLHTSTQADTGASIASGIGGVSGRHETIQITTIDTIVDTYQLPYISYVKLDIEGSEFAALQGAKQSIEAGIIEAIEFEFLWKNIDSRVFLRDFWELLSPYYDFYRILPHHIYPIQDYHHLLEIYCLSNFLCIKKCSNSKNV